MPLYQLTNIVHHYNGTPVLSIDHWRLPEGSISGLYGPNGSGKSTLLKLLGFVERPSCGEILLNGRKTAPFDEAARETVALLPQDSFLLKRSVYQNMAYGLRIRKKRQGLPDRIKEALSLVGLDYDRFARRPWFALSGGEARRVALAARLVLQPRVLLLDEPTASVDTASIQRIREAAVYAHQQWGTSLIIASHNFQWLQDICDDIVHLFQGKLLGRGRRTLLFGPWQMLDEKRVCMQLAGNQTFIVAKAPPGAKKHVAAVDPSYLSLHQCAGQTSPGKARLEGILTSLSLDRLSGRINASVMIGHTVFNIFLSPENLASGGFTPGCKVWIDYSPEEVTWC